MAGSSFLKEPGSLSRLQASTLPAPGSNGSGANGGVPSSALRSSSQLSEYAFDPANGVVDHGVIWDEEFAQLAPPHSVEERAGLEQLLLADKVCLQELVLWQGCNRLLDGYTRFQICTRHGIAFKTLHVELADRVAAKDWILAHQTGRRNLSANGWSYTRGSRYLLEKQRHGGQKPHSQGSGQGEYSALDCQGSGHSDYSRTVRRLGLEYSVSATTIQRDAVFAAAVDIITLSCGKWVKEVVLGHKPPLSRREVIMVSRMGAGDQREIMAAIQRGCVHKPWKREPAEPSFRVPRNVDGLIETLLRELGREQVCEVSRKLALLNPQ
jgi:hypothetical protein